MKGKGRPGQGKYVKRLHEGQISEEWVNEGDGGFYSFDSCDKSTPSQLNISMLYLK